MTMPDEDAFRVQIVPSSDFHHTVIPRLLRAGEAISSAGVHVSRSFAYVPLPESVKNRNMQGAGLDATELGRAVIAALYSADVLIAIIADMRAAMPANANPEATKQFDLMLSDVRTKRVTAGPPDTGSEPRPEEPVE